MDFSLLINEAFETLWWLIPLAFVISLLKLPWFKGVLGEALVKLAARIWLPKAIYHPIHNVTLPTEDGTTQIDHIFVSRYGIFVVETKHMKGWIFGGEHQAQWAQKLYRKSFRFQNPLRQNYKHVKALEALLEVPADAIHSVVVFSGDSTFKAPMPVNVTRGGGYIRYIKSFREIVLTEAQVQKAAAQIESGRLAPTRETQRQHVALLQSRAKPEGDRPCPQCGSKMVLRKARRGAKVGSPFWGCSAYPKCRAVQKTG